MTDKKLKSIVDRIENLEEERKAIGGDIRDIYTEAKGGGYDPKILRKIIARRRKDAAELAAEEAEIARYSAALGMAVDLVRGGMSLRDAERATGASKSSIHRALRVPAPSQDADGVIIETAPASQPLSEPASGARSDAITETAASPPPAAGEAREIEGSPGTPAAIPFDDKPAGQTTVHNPGGSHDAGSLNRPTASDVARVAHPTAPARHWPPGIDDATALANLDEAEAEYRAALRRKTAEVVA